MHRADYLIGLCIHDDHDGSLPFQPLSFIGLGLGLGLGLGIGLGLGLVWS